MGRWISLALCLALAAGTAAAQSNYTLFESGPVRPLALSPDGTKLFACNIPDGRLEIFSVASNGLALIGSVPVGLEPVAVAARTNGEVWVVNHVSDSISIVDVATQRVTQTLLVGDEPRDIVFAGTGHNRAFITAAHRGQNRPGDPQLTSSGVGRSDVWVFDATNPGGSSPTILSLFGDTPRALAASPDGSIVYVAVFHSGDQTTIVPAGQIATPPPAFNVPDPNQTSNPVGQLPTPQVGVMLKYQSGTTWVDVTGTGHTGMVQFNLPDHDVFMLDATASPPAQTSVFDHVGTILFNMAVNPISGVVYVSNTDANNFDRFEASDARFNATDGTKEPNVRGELHHAQISILSGSTTVTPRRLNKQIDYTVTASAAVNAASLAIPTDMAVKSDGSTLYVAAFGSGEIGVIDTAALALPPTDPNSFQPNAANHIHLSAGGPGGVILDEPHNRLYVYTRFDDGISLVDPTAKVEVGHLTVHNPETPDILNGRHFLYDAHLTSSNGEASCAVCHVFADFDSLAWDLGNPDPNAPLASNFNPFVKILSGTTGAAIAGPTLVSLGLQTVPGNLDFHPLKGPMTTQTLRGMKHNGPMHWRGDRSGGNFTNGVPNFDGDPNALDPNQAFGKFNPAFQSLLGNATQLAPADMTAYTNFILRVTMPPNPIRNLDQTLTASQTTGQTFYLNTTSDTIKACAGCHTLNQAGSAFGTGGLSTFEGLSQHFKVPQLRNAYEKVGMYGMEAVPGTNIPAHGSPSTDQIRGFGYLNDGSIDNVISFLNGGVFTFPSDPNNDPSANYGNSGAAMRQNVTNFVMAFPSDLAPIVGQQITLTSTNGSDPNVTNRITLLEQRAVTAYHTLDNPGNECDLVVKGTISGVTRGWWMSASNTFTPDSSSDSTQTDASLRALASTPGQELTFTCVPPGSGQRMGIDRGGVGDGSQPDGIRDANQCGDVTADGIAGAADVTAERAALAAISTPKAPGKCNVAGGAGSTPPTYDIVDLVVLRRALANLGPGLSTGCNG